MLNWKIHRVRDHQNRSQYQERQNMEMILVYINTVVTLMMLTSGKVRQDMATELLSLGILTVQERQI